MKLSRMNRMLACLSMLGMSTTGWAASSDWELVFNDEFSAASFNGSTLDWADKKWNKIDYVNWTVADWRKYQSQDDTLVTSGTSNGTDYVTLKGAYGDYTSQDDKKGTDDGFACGGIFTDKTFSFRYGYVEVRARFESAAGVWPAIWLLPKNGNGWPDSGEIDIMEHINNESNVWQTLHMLNDAGSGKVSPTQQSPISNAKGWHTYGMEWTEDYISFYIDGVCTASFNASDYENWPFGDDGSEFYLLIDQQIGGSWAGAANKEALSKDSVDFDIDYVRVYSTQKNSPSAAECPTWSVNGPVETDGSAIAYNNVTGVTSGALEHVAAGNYSYTVKGDIGRILAEGSHIRLATLSGTDVFKMKGDMVQARSLYIAEGKYDVSGNAAIDVDTLYVVGGSLQVESANSLNSVEQLYLGMEKNVFNEFAQRNASLYISADQHVMADVTLVDDSKIAVYQGNTLKISGNIDAEGHTLNLVGVDSGGIADIELCGKENRISNLWLGVSGTTEAGNTFNGAGQILRLTFGEGSQTTIDKLLINRKDDTSQTSTTIINRGLLHVQTGAKMNVDYINVDASTNESGNRAVLKVDGSLTANSVFLDGNTWKSLGDLEIRNGDDVHISTISTGTHGQVYINVQSGHLILDSLTLGNSRPMVMQAEQHAVGTISVRNTVANTNEVKVRYGRVEFSGGLSGSGVLEVEENAVVSVSSSAGNQKIKVSSNAVLETAGSYSGGTVSGSGTIRKTDADTAKVVTAADFTGSVRAEKGNMQVKGSDSFTALAAAGGNIQLTGTGAITARSIQVEQGNTLKVLGTNEQIGTLKLATGGVLKAGSGTLVANCWCGEGATLDLSVSGGLTVEGALTLAGRVTLGDEVIRALAAEELDSFTLALGLASFTMGDSEWELGQSASADTLFEASGIDLSGYTLHYLTPLTRSEMGGMLVLTRSIPEPATAALSLLGVLALAAYRRRR